MCHKTAFHVTGLVTEWVKSLSLHPELDTSRRAEKLFRFPLLPKFNLFIPNSFKTLAWALSQSRNAII